jgi:hypothetical protein
MSDFIEGIKAYELNCMRIRWTYLGVHDQPLDTGIYPYSTMVSILKKHEQDVGPFQAAMEEGKRFRFISPRNNHFWLEVTNE